MIDKPITKHPLLEWHISQDSGILTIEPMGPNYANGDTREDGICFYDEEDAMRQLIHLIAIISERFKDARKCIGCGTVLLTGNNVCPNCHTDNEDK